MSGQFWYMYMCGFFLNIEVIIFVRRKVLTESLSLLMILNFNSEETSFLV